MNNFKIAFSKKLQEVQYNNFGNENYDEFRFGKYDGPERISPSLMQKTKGIVKKIIGYDNKLYDKLIKRKGLWLEDYLDRIEFVYVNLSDIDRELLVSLIAYRILGYTKVKLPRNNKEYWQALDKVKTLKCSDETYDPHFLHFILEKFDLKPIGYDIELFFNYYGIAIDFIIEQYAYKLKNKTLIQAEKGDVVLDIGGCWGDTALYFAKKVGDTGKVFSFEFIPDNIKLHNINTQLNPHLQQIIELVTNPVANTTGDIIYFKDNGPGSKIENHPFDGQTGSTTTISIDNFVVSKNLQKVDFIKMDIEGAEPIALQGAIETIKKYRPTLAIAIYHSMEDFVNIPKWILDLNLDYEIFLGHYTIHSEETVCFAKPRKK